MVDYSELLRRAITNAPDGSQRRDIYARARAALVEGLRRADKRPMEITRERLSLEEAVRAVEAEAAERLKDGV